MGDSGTGELADQIQDLDAKHDYYADELEKIKRGEGVHSFKAIAKDVRDNTKDKDF